MRPFRRGDFDRRSDAVVVPPSNLPAQPSPGWVSLVEHAEAMRHAGTPDCPNAEHQAILRRGGQVLDQLRRVTAERDALADEVVFLRAEVRTGHATIVLLSARLADAAAERDRAEHPRPWPRAA